MKIKDIMTKPAVTVSPKDSILTACKVMQQHNIGTLAVVEHDKLVGILTDRDVLIRSTAREFDAEKHPVSEIMTTHVRSVSPDTDYDEASRTMANEQIRRLPVVSDGSVVGMVSLGDMACRCNCHAEIAETLADISR